MTGIPDSLSRRSRAGYDDGTPEGVPWSHAPSALLLTRKSRGRKHAKDLSSERLSHANSDRDMTTARTPDLDRLTALENDVDRDLGGAFLIFGESPE